MYSYLLKIMHELHKEKSIENINFLLDYFEYGSVFTFIKKCRRIYEK